MYIDIQYEQALKKIMSEGKPKPDRTGTGTTSLFGLQMRWSLHNDTWPVITSKKVHVKSVIAELLWMLSGSTNVQDLDATIWDEWADEDGNLGCVYGAQWRSWGGHSTDNGHSYYLGIDQLAKVMQQMQNTPHDRGHIVSAWNVAALSRMALRPCHALFQFDITDGKLSCQLYQRSADMFLGVPFNIAGYSLLTHMVAQQLCLEPGEFIWSGGDCHIYDNHREQVKLQLSRGAREFPTLFLERPSSLFDYSPDLIHIENYNPHPAIPAPVAV